MAKKKPAPKHEPEIATKIGRPVYWTEERAETAFQTICERLTLGESLRAICAAQDMPDVWTVMKWLKESPGFAQRYAHARELQAEFYAEAIIDIADGRLPPDKDALEIKLRDSGDTAVEVVTDPVARDRLRIDARKWIAAKLLPTKYGERIEQHVTVDDRRAEVIEIIERMELAALARPDEPEAD